MSDYSDLEDSLGVAHAWPLTDAGATFVDRVAGVNLTCTAGTVTNQSVTIANGTPTVALNGSLTGTGALTTMVDWTMNVWVKIAVDQGPGLPLYNGSSGGNGAGMFIAAHHTGSLGSEFQGLHGGVGFTDSAPTTVTHGSVFMLSMKRTGGTTTLLVNGVSVGTSATGINLPSSITEITLVGDVGFAAIWTSAVSDANLLSLYSVGSRFLADPPMALTWSGIPAVFPVYTNPLELSWNGVPVHLPDIPPLFPTTGRRAIDPGIYRTSWSGAAAHSVTGFDSFTMVMDVNYTITAHVFLEDGTPGLPQPNGIPPDFIYAYFFCFEFITIPVDTFDVATGVVTFHTGSATFHPGVMNLRLVFTNIDGIVSAPTYSCTVTILES